MIPSTLLGLLLFVSVLGPGYVWLRYTETRVLRAERSGVLEAADVIFVGALATGLSAFVVLGLGPRLVGLPTLSEILGLDSSSSEELASLIAAGVLIVLLAVFGTLLFAYLLFGAHKKLIRPGVSIWQTVMGIPSREWLVAIAVELKDGRFIEGQFLAHTVGSEEDEKHLALGAPLRIVWPATASDPPRTGQLPADRMVVSASEIVTISAKDVARRKPEPARKWRLLRPSRPGQPPQRR